MRVARVTPVGPELWSVEVRSRLAPGVNFPLRMTVVRLSGRDLLLHSPVPIDDGIAQELADLGRVTELLAPNKFHHLHLEAAAKRYPEARIWGAPGLAGKLPGVGFTGVLGLDTPGDWLPSLDQHHVSGVPMINEVVFLHRPSSSLLVTDLVFHINELHGVLSPLVLHLVGGTRGFMHSRAWRWFFVRDRAAAGADVERILAWDFERIVPCHGDLLEVDARLRLAYELAYLLSTRGTPGARP